MRRPRERRTGGDGDGDDSVTRVASTGDGGVAAIAWTPTAHAIRLDAGGTLRWSRVLPATIESEFEDEQNASIAVAPDGDVVIAGTDPREHTTYLARLGDDGAVAVEHTFAGVMVHDLAVTASADIALVGQIWRGGDLGGGPPPVEGAIDVLVATLDRDLGHRWSMAFGDLGIFQSATAVALGVDGMIAFGGQNVTTLDLGGQPLSSSTQDLFLARFFP